MHLTKLSQLMHWSKLHLTKRTYILLGSAVLTAALVAGAATEWNRTTPVTLPEQTAIRVTLNQALSSNRSEPGETFEASVAEPVVVAGKTAIPEPRGPRCKGAWWRPSTQGIWSAGRACT
jgi:hypothetical protein